MVRRRDESERALRRYLSAAQLRTGRRVLERLAERAFAKWGADGFAFVGASPRIRLSIRVPQRLAQPRHPVGPLPLPASLGGGLLKPAVHASHAEPAGARGTPSAASGGCVGVAPASVASSALTAAWKAADGG